MAIGLLNGIVEITFDKLSKGTANAIKNLMGGISGKVIQEAVDNGTIRKWATESIRNYGKQIASESIQEALQDLITMVGQNGAFKVANDQGAQFKDEFYTWDEMSSAIIETIKKTASGTAILGLPQNIITTATSWTQGNKTEISKANKTSKQGESSIIVDIKDLDAKKAEGDKVDLSPIDHPVKAVQVGDKYKPVGQDARAVSEMKRDGGKKAHVEIVNENGEFTDNSRHTAQDIADNIGAGYSEGFIVFDTKTQAKTQAEKFALSQDSLVGFAETENGYVATVRTYGVNESIGFAWKETKPDAQKAQPRRRVQPVADNGIYRTIEEADGADKKRFDSLFSSINKLKWKDDKSFIRDKFIAPATNIFMEQGYDEDTALMYARRDAIIAKNVSNIIGMSAKEYYGENFSNRPIQIITPEMEADIRNSAAWRNSVMEMRLQEGITDDADLADDIATRQMKGFLRRENGLKTIYVSKDMDASTISHEISHALLDELVENEVGKNLVDSLYGAELNRDGGKVGVNVQEAFARDFSQYQLTGKMKSKKMSGFFKRMVDAVRNIFSMFSGELPAKTVDQFDKLMKIGEGNVRGDEVPLVTARDGYLDSMADKLESGDIEGIARMLESGESESMQVGDDIWQQKSNQKFVKHIRQYAERYDKFGQLREGYEAPTQSESAKLLKIANLNGWNARLLRTVYFKNGIYFRNGQIEHIIKRHGIQGITSEHIAKIQYYVENPIAVIKPTGKNANSLVFVTEDTINVPFHERKSGDPEICPVVVSIRNYQIGSNKIVAGVSSIFPWLPSKQLNYNGYSLEAYMQVPGLTQAIDKERIGGASFLSKQVVDDLTHNRSILNIDQFSRQVNDKERINVKRKQTPDDTSFQVGSALSVQDVAKAIQDTSSLVEQIDDARLEQILDGNVSEAFKETVAKEVRFRNVYRNDTTLVTLARKAFSEYRSLVDEFDWNDAVGYMLKYIDEHGDRNDWNMETETGDTRWFAQRMVRYLSDGGRNRESVIEDKIKVGETTRRQQRDVLASDNYGKVVKDLVSKGIANRNTISTLSDAMERVVRRLGVKDPSISDINDLITKTLRERSENAHADAQEIDRLTRRVNVLETYKDLKNLSERMDKKRKELGRIAKVVDGADSIMNNALYSFWRSMDKGTAISERDYLELGGMFDDYIQDLDGQYAAVPFNDMTLGKQMDALREVMKTYKNMAKEQRDANVAKKKAETNKLIKDAASGMYKENFESVEEANARIEQDLQDRKFGGDIDEAQYEGNLFKKAMSKIITYSRTIASMGEGMYTLFFGDKDHPGIYDAAEKENRGILDRTKEAQTAFKDILSMTRREFNKFMRFGRFNEWNAEFTSLSGNKYNIAEVIGMYAYSKQDDAVRHMLADSGHGNGYTQEMLDFVNEHLEPQYKAIGDYIIGDSSGRYGAVAETFYQVQNKRLGQIQNYLTLVGSTDTTYMDEELEIRTRHRDSAVNSSITKERTFGLYPLEMDIFKVFDRSVKMQEHYIASALKARQLDYMLSADGGNLYNLVKVKYGKETADVMAQLVEEFKRPTNVFDDLDKAMGTLRNHFIIARLSFAPMSVLKQFPTLAFAIVKSDNPLSSFVTVTKYMLNPSYRKMTSDFIYSMSAQMENRNVSIELQSVRDWNPNNQMSRYIKQLGDWGMSWLEKADRMVANAIWMSTYEANIRKGMDEATASRDATQFILDTQPGGMKKDNAPLYNSKNELAKWLFLFSNALNKEFNMLFYDVPDAIKKQEIGRAAATIFGVTIASIGMAMVGGGAIDDDDDDWNIDDLAKNTLAELSSTIPLFGSSIQGMIQGYRYTSANQPPITDIPGDISNLVKAISSRDADRIVAQAKNMSVTAAETTGLPAGAIQRGYNMITHDWNFGYLLNSEWGSWYDDK